MLVIELPADVPTPTLDSIGREIAADRPTLAGMLIGFYVDLTSRRIAEQAAQFRAEKRWAA